MTSRDPAALGEGPDPPSPTPQPPHPPPNRNRNRHPPHPPHLAPPPPPGTADVYVTTRSDFRAQLRRCQRLLAGTARGGDSSGRGGATRELRLHGLGLAAPRAINLALQLLLAAPQGALRLLPSTGSVPRPLRRKWGEGQGEGDGGEGDEEGEGELEGGGGKLRHNSAIHIRVCRGEGWG
ncbi:ribonuclease P protein subunit p20 [Patagioenas fasciata]|uniref:ribonuclease P protein subunit p20 n=1 Tax=Patagioenas fasciata TaxID=372321 RepID=UPI003A995887